MAQRFRTPRRCPLTDYLADTTFLVSAERSGNLPNPDENIATAAISVAEMYVGVEMTTDKNLKNDRRVRVESVLAQVPVVDYTKRVAKVHAELLAHARRTGLPSGPHDLIIAATAKATDRTVITNDNDGFADLPGVSVVAHQ